MRIVSLLPGATETACALGLLDDLVGISHECDWPPGIEAKPRLTRPLVDTRRLSSGEISEAIGSRRRAGEAIFEIDRDRLRSLRPDLVLTQSVCGVCAVPAEAVHRALAGLVPPPRVLSMDGSTLEEVLADIEGVGEAAGRAREARSLLRDLRGRIDRAGAGAGAAPARPRVVCLEWIDPPMAAGHWIPEMVERAGGLDLLGEPGGPSAWVSWERVVEAAPEHLFLLPCGFDAERTASEVGFLRSRPGWSDLQAVRDGRVHVLDGNAAFTRPGPRLVDGLETMARRLRPVGEGARAAPGNPS